MKIVQHAALLLLGSAIVSCHAAYRISSMKIDDLREFTSEWPTKPRDAVEVIASKYGRPEELTQTMLIWYNKGPWTKTVLMRNEIEHNFPTPHTDFLQQTINYKVPLDKYDELARYDGSIIIDRTKGTLSARCDKEEMNFLALNLANDIITGRKTVEQARVYYANAAMKFKQGTADLYTQGLQFPANNNSADRDVSARF
jgi:hypothetical protein